MDHRIDHSNAAAQYREGYLLTSLSVFVRLCTSLRCVYSQLCLELKWAATTSDHREVGGRSLGRAWGWGGLAASAHQSRRVISAVRLLICCHYCFVLRRGVVFFFFSLRGRGRAGGRVCEVCVR